MNKKFSIALITMLMGMIIFASCGTSQTPVDNKTPTTLPKTEDNTLPQPESSKAKELNASEDLKLGKIKVNMPKSEVDKNMTGKISKTTKDNKFDIETEIVTYEDGTVIHLVSKKVYSVTVNFANYPTPRGLKVGDTEASLKKLYGNPTKIQADGKWTYSSRGYDLFFVTVKDGIVAEIMVSHVM
jgi:hypothetical protein